jgi:hypothetical protein
MKEIVRPQVIGIVLPSVGTVGSTPVATRELCDQLGQYVLKPSELLAGPEGLIQHGLGIPNHPQRLFGREPQLTD